MFDKHTLTRGAASLKLKWRTWNAAYSTNTFVENWNELKAQVAAGDLTPTDMLAITRPCLPALARNNDSLIPLVVNDLLEMTQNQPQAVRVATIDALTTIIPVMAQAGSSQISHILPQLVDAVPKDKPLLTLALVSVGNAAIQPVAQHGPTFATEFLIEALANTIRQHRIDPNQLIDASLRAIPALKVNPGSTPETIIYRLGKLTERNPSASKTFTDVGLEIAPRLSESDAAATAALFKALAKHAQNDPATAERVFDVGIEAAQTLLQQGENEEATEVLSTITRIAAPKHLPQAIELALGRVSVKGIILAANLAKKSTAGQTLFEDRGTKALRETFLCDRQSGQVLLDYLLRSVEDAPEKSARLIDHSLALAKKFLGQDHRISLAILDTLTLNRCLAHKPETHFDNLGSDLPSTYNGFTSRELMVSPSFGSPFNMRSYVLLGKNEASSTFIVPWANAPLLNIYQGQPEKSDSPTQHLLYEFAHAARKALAHRETLPSLKASAAKPAVA